ncbi:MAG: ATP-dependent DNA helicase [Candidatus Paceibacterota bacterium]|jgi:DNA helicase-2/ATP-dependent DNA helicase PcrA
MSKSKIITQLPTFEDRYLSLNDAQKKAVDTTDGPVMVIAGPGSGKTELLSLRVGNILKQGTARASNILCLTFTETAARNMRERLETLIGVDAYRVAIYTFHGFCTDIIGRYPEYFFEATHFRPASDLIQSEILEKIFERLPHKHPLGGFHPERGYAYLKEAQVRIKDIKKGGLTPERFKELIKENEEAFKLLNQILVKHLPERIGKDSYASFEAMKSELNKTGTNLGKMYAKSIEHALEDAEHEEKTTPLSEWKTNHTGKEENGTRVFKDFLAIPKLLALADVYKMYQEALHAGGYFDYEDMILQVVSALEKRVSLRTELEELYQYIMVDEFQDTNNAQLSLVKAISSNEVHEGRPNVCVVGDDDQAIYKFQGAEISNIHNFKELYKDVETIVLTKNYRSTQKVLDFARAIVTQGKDRLETRYKEIRKDLEAKNENLPIGDIHTLSFSTQEEENTYVAEEVAKLLKAKVEAKEIALIAREHKQLISILPYLDALHIPYTYTRKENVFDERHVKELIMLCRYLSTIGASELQRDDLLPQILAFPFWDINRINIWRIAEHAKRENISWLSAMEQSDDAKIRDLAAFLIELGIASQTTPLEIILDTLIGSKDIPVSKESPDDDVDEPFTSLKLKTNFTSPYKEYYFGKNAFEKNASEYINFLSSLRVFMRALREYKEGEPLRVHDVGDFVDMHTSYNIPLINETPFAHNENSVQLLTSHGAKGLEFSYVFIISANDAIWAGKPKGNKLSFPINLPLANAGDTEDDFIRLFYVALTRARHTLYITHHNSPLRFLSSGNLPETDNKAPSIETSELLAEGLQVYHAPPFAQDEKALLKKVVEGYMLSPTHLNNFLNIIDGGPMMFLEQNLLRFPQAKNASSVYGTAIHKALEDAHVLARRDGKLSKLDAILESFDKELKKGRLQDFEEEKLRARGEKVLERYYELKKNEIKGEHVVELNFAKQSVVLDGALLNGKIDKIIENDDGEWQVVDLKTGKGFESWDEPKLTVYDEIKLHHYRYQLMMYKVLVENSRDYNTHNVTSGVLEFVEEEINDKILELTLSFEDKNTKDELDRFKKLIVAVYEKIVSLDFPDTSKYPQTLDGIKEFEEDLIASKK